MKLSNRILLNALYAASFTIASTHVAQAQNYPAHPVHILTSEAGGGLDFAARMIAQGMNGSFGQQVIVDNRGGAGGIIAVEAVAKAQPDGYNLVLYGSNIWLLSFLQDNVPWDATRDFAPVSLVASSPNILVLNPSVPANSVKELIALAKAKPGELNYGGGSAGSSTHLSAELFKSMAGVNIVRIPFKGTASALTAVLGGQIQMMFVTAGTIAPHIKSGRLKALATTGSKPSALMPELPTIAAAGLPGYESVSIVAILAPAKTPTAIVTKLNQEIIKGINRSDVKERFLAAGVEPVGSSPAELAATMKSEIVRMGKVIKDAGIRAE